MTAPVYDIVATSGDVAEAEGVENAVFAAKTLVEEAGGGTASVHLGDFEVGEARMREGGEVVFLALQGVLKGLR